MSQINKTRCKVIVGSVIPASWKESDGSQPEVVSMYGVYSNGNVEDDNFSKSSPSINFSIMISNPAAQGFFKQGKAYYADFTSAEKI